MGNPQRARKILSSRKIIYVKKESHLKLKYESSTHMHTVTQCIPHLWVNFLSPCSHYI
jgi:hypothetical protein